MSQTCLLKKNLNKKIIFEIFNHFIIWYEEKSFCDQKMVRTQIPVLFDRSLFAPVNFLMVDCATVDYMVMCMCVSAVFHLHLLVNIGS